MSDDRPMSGGVDFFVGLVGSLGPELGAPVASFGRELGENADLRRRFEIDPRAVLEERGVFIPADTELHVTANTDETYHVPMPPDPNVVLADQDLVLVTAGTGARAGTASTVGSFACSTGPSSMSTLSSWA